VRINENRLFDSAENPTLPAQADNAAGQAPQNNNAMRLLSRRRSRKAPHAGDFLSMAT